MPGKQDWETPWPLFNYLHRQYQFTIDVASDGLNNKVKRYLTPKDNALTTELTNEIIWCNPPYQNVLPWAQRFIHWSRGNIVVTLLQDKTDTEWFELLFSAASSVTFLTGRVNFIGTETGNMHGAVLFELRPGHRDKSVTTWDWRKDCLNK